MFRTKIDGNDLLVMGDGCEGFCTLEDDHCYYVKILDGKEEGQIKRLINKAHHTAVISNLDKVEVPPRKVIELEWKEGKWHVQGYTEL